MNYQLQYSTDLVQWLDLGDSLTAINAKATASDTIGPGRERFYRVRMFP